MSRELSGRGEIDGVAATLRGATDEEIRRITARVNQVVMDSFQSDRIVPGTLDSRGKIGVRSATQAEYRERAVTCVRLIADMWRGAGWTLVRSLEHLPQALRYRLEGLDWDPEPANVNGTGTGRSTWAPGAIEKWSGSGRS